MSPRSTSSGLSVSVMGKQASKYNEQEGALLLEWIKQVTGESRVQTSGSCDNFVAQLKDGTLLCKFASRLVPGSVIKGVCQPAPATFQQINNLGLFIDFCRAQGVIGQELFRAVDLVEARDLYSVCMTLNALGRIMAKKGRPHPGHVSPNAIVNLPMQDQLRIQEIKTF